jgi:thioredoxin reductase (NADPH)
MPGMAGTDYLVRARQIVPDAKRVLLTAYADTEAAIAAINDVALDYYLLKPWDPPEEKLYPVVDAMLQSYADQPEVTVHETKVIGHRWSAPSFEARDFLARNAVPYRWFASDEPDGERLLRAAELGSQTLPVVITPTGEILVAPSTSELAGAVGLSTTPAMDFYDVVVVGAGPAGLGAAVYAASEGLRTLLVERQATGGQAGQSSRIENYLGFPDGVSGAQLTERARRQAIKFGAELLTTSDATALASSGWTRVVSLRDGHQVAAHSVIIATGVSYRDLDAPGVAALAGRGVYYGSAPTEVDDCADRDVYIVGGANSAGQAAVFFSRVARSVTLLVRGDGLERSMSHYLIEQIRGIASICVRSCTVVEEAHGIDHLEKLTLRHLPTGAVEHVHATHLFVFIGATPHTEWLSGVLERDGRGFILTGSELTVDRRRPSGWPLERDPWPLESSVPGVFVTGDVRASSIKRVASAVGEGAMAVTLAHRYLAP